MEGELGAEIGATLHTIGVVCTPVVTQVDKIHIHVCRRVATIKVKECWNHCYSSEIMHTGIWWGKPVRVKCVLWVSWCQVVVYRNASPSRRGDKWVWMCPKEAVVVWTLTKVIRLEGTVLAWDVQPAWWLDLKATSDERMCCADGYESILGFSFPYCHQTLLHLAKITMSSWHSVLPIHMSSHNISRITLDVSLTGTATTNSIYCCFSLFSGWPGHFYGLG